MEWLSFEKVWSYNTAHTWFLVACVVTAIVLGRIVGMVLRRGSRTLSARGLEGLSQSALDLIGPARLAIWTAGLALGVYGVTAKPPIILVKILQMLFCVAALWYAFNLISVVEAILKKLTARSGAGLELFVPLVRKTLRIFVVVVGALVVLSAVFEQNIGAWLAGLGLAGLAISLAAQDSIKTLFGSITILLDRPFRIGERIIFAGQDGTVEEIGFRSTKLRTAAGSLVTIPNSDIVNKPIENVGRRPSIHRAINVSIPYGTPAAKIHQAVDVLRRILEEDGIREPIHRVIRGEKVVPRVHFQDFDAQRLNISVLYWYAPPEYWDYMDHAQRLNLRIFEEFEKAGIEFALPAQTLQLVGDEKRQLVVKTLGKDLDRPS